jgi:Sugar transferases involved in lipopolysaccharide synthesis
MYRIVKRGLDVIISVLALIVALVPLLLLMAIIRLDSKGSPIFRQERVGRYGQPFTIYKLRTMRQSAPHDVATSELQDAHMHITRIGRFLRKTSLDELPQLYNVLRGDMSLIGPRPLVASEGSIHEERMACGAYDVRPGVTGWAQVNGRDQVNAGKKAEMDGYYAQHINFFLDFKILFMSALYVLTARGIQEGVQPVQEPEEAAVDTVSENETISL